MNISYHGTLPSSPKQRLREAPSPFPSLSELPNLFQLFCSMDPPDRLSSLRPLFRVVLDNFFQVPPTNFPSPLFSPTLFFAPPLPISQVLCGYINLGRGPFWPLPFLRATFPRLFADFTQSHLLGLPPYFLPFPPPSLFATPRSFLFPTRKDQVPRLLIKPVLFFSLPRHQ